MHQYNFLSQKLHKTLISKTTVFLSYAQDSQWATTMDWADGPMLPLHRLSLRKSPIKNYNNIILGQVIIRIKYN